MIYFDKGPTRGSACLACGQRRGEMRQALIGQSGSRKRYWLCVGCAESAANRRAFVDAYADLLGLDAGGGRPPMETAPAPIALLSGGRFEG